MAGFYDLPPEILLKIFQFYLKTECQAELIYCLSRVCVMWNEIIYSNRTLWTKFDGSVHFSEMMKLCGNGCLTSTKEMIISRTDNLKGDDECNLLFYCLPNVEILNFSNVRNISKNVFWLIVDNCTELKEIHVGQEIHVGSYKNYTRLSDVSLLPFLASLGSGLTKIQLSYCYIEFFSKVLLCISAYCINLEHLIITNNCSKEIFPTSNFQQQCKKLKILRLDSKIRISNRTSSTGFPHLEEFTYGGSDSGGKITSSNLQCILFDSPHLKVLKLTNCTIQLETWSNLPIYSLECLSIARSTLSGYRDVSVIFSKWSHSLKELDISHCNDCHLNSAIWKLVTARNESRLEILNLNSTKILAGVVDQVLQRCSRLQVLKLEDCSNLERGMKNTYWGKSELKVLHKMLLKSAGIEVKELD